MISKEMFNSLTFGEKSVVHTNIITVEDWMDCKLCFVSWLSESNTSIKKYYVLVETSNNPSKQINKMCERKYGVYGYSLDENDNHRLDKFFTKNKWIKNDFYITIFDIWFSKITNMKNIMKTNLKNIVDNIKDSIRYKP